mgnify:CR=1 FL=1
MINNSIKYKHYAQIIVEVLMHNIQKRQNKLTIIYYHDNVFSSQKIIKTEVNNMTKSTKEYQLNVPAPSHYTFAVRDIPNVTVEQRERALKATHYNEFAFPAGMLTIDMLSDSGTTAMTNHQWASLFLGDESYGRNTGP